MAARVLSQNIFQRVELLLRRDLKLGADAQISQDMPLLGGDLDLDSLDILLLVTSIEKEFGLKIPSEAIGKEIFQSVGTLVDYVEAHGGAPAPGAATDHLARLPHRNPFRFVSQVIEVRDGEFARGIWTVSGVEPFFAGHFPGNPLVPGVLLAEALAQISGLAGGGNSGGVLALLDVRFDKPVTPPANIALESKLKRTIGALQQFDVRASVGDATIASGTITLHRTSQSAS